MGFMTRGWFNKPTVLPLKPAEKAPSLAPLPVVPVQEMAAAPIEEETIALRWADAAVKMGISPESVKSRARRANWRRTAGDDGRTLVHIPACVLSRARQKDGLVDAYARSLKRVSEIESRLAGKMALIERLGISYHSMDQYMRAGDFPSPINMMNRRLMWRISEVDEWVESKKKQATQEEGSTVYNSSDGKTIIYTPAKGGSMNALSKYIINKRPEPASCAPPLVCRDGFSMSVQASEYHYCSPRNNEGPWMEFECGFPSGPAPELKEWKEEIGDRRDEECVFAYVPWVVLMLTIEKHGGCDVLEEMK